MKKMFDRHGRAAMFFSAGKDSLAMLHLLRDYWDRFTVVWCNPGAPHPDVVDYMRKIQALVPHFQELHGNQPEWVKMHGWPADVVPARATTAAAIGVGEVPIKFQSYMDCCGANMWAPMQRYVDSMGIDLVMMGQRREEALRNRVRDDTYQVVDGVAFWNPINDWTSKNVLDFLDGRGLELPPLYANGATSSVDCWNCTAYLDHNGGRLSYMRQHEPEQYAQVYAVLAQLWFQIQADVTPLEKTLKGS